MNQEKSRASVRSIMHFLLLLFVIGAHAQNITPGYYRVTNVGLSSYGGIIKTKTVKEECYAYAANGSYQIVSGSGAKQNIQSIQLWAGLDNAIVSPQTVMYISKVGDNGQFEAQGKTLHEMIGIDEKMIINLVSGTTDTYTLTTLVNGISASFWVDKNKTGTYNMFGETDSYTNYQTTFTSQDYDLYRQWKLVPISSSTSNYVAVNASLKVNDPKDPSKYVYYAPYYASYPFKLISPGMKVYYVSSISNTGYTLTEITSEVIPAETPVIIQCPSSDPADCKIEPLLGNYGSISDNKLKGVYFCNLSMSPQTDPECRTEFKAESMRVWAVKDGQLVLTNNPDKTRAVPLALSGYSGIWLRANESYLPEVPSTAAADLLPEVGVSLASGLGEKAKVEFYDGGETAPDATTFDPSAYKPFGEEGANEIKVYDNSAGAGRYIIVHVVPTGFEYWTDASLLSVQETGASVTGTASALTLLKRDTYDSDGKTYTRYDGAGWYCYKLPGDHTVAAGYSSSTLGGDAVKTFNLDPANSTEGTFTQNGNEVILTNGEGWQASLTYDQISWTFDGQSHHPATTTITVTKGDKTLKLTSATDIAQQIVDGEEYNPAAIATHYIKIGAKPYSWFKQSQYNIATFSITVPFPGKGTEAEPWLVQGAKNLVLLAQCVNTGCYSFDKEYVKLDNGEGYSYDMSAVTGFEPIGLIDDEHNTPFCGTFDGNGVTISGINYTFNPDPTVAGDAERYCIGLFGQLGHSAADPADRKEGTVKNLTLSNCTFASESEKACYVGGVVGYIDNGSLTDGTVIGCNISATKDGSRVGAIASGVNTATLTRNYYKYDTKVTLGKAVATDYAKRGIGTATGGDDVATNDGAMLWVKKASLGDITKPTGSGGAVAFAENTPGVNCYAVDGDDILYAVGKSVSLSVSPGTSTDGIRTFGDELAALTMNDGTSNTDIKDARAFTMPKTDVTISGTLSQSKWFNIKTNGNRWMSFCQEWGNYAVSGVSSGASGTRRGGLLIELLTIGSIDFDAGVATLADLGGSSFKGVPMFFHCEDGLPEQLRFDPVEGKTAPQYDSQFIGGVSDLSAFADQAVFVLFGSELVKADLSGSTAFDPNKAFVAASTKSATRLTLVRDGATAIDLVTTSDEGEGKWFDLQGRQLDGKPSKKGLYIRDGKKMIIK